MERLLRWIWSLYPRSFRERFGRELERDLVRRIAAGRRVGVSTVLDALVTLVRAWARASTEALTLGGLATDLRLALRALRRSPGYAATVVAILALALGANTAVFSVTHAVLLRALPYGAPERVVSVQPTPLVIEDDRWKVDPDFLALPHVAAAALYVDGGGANLALQGSTERVTLAQVTEDFFDVLRVDPVVGRAFVEGDGADLAILSYGFWVRAFGASADALGRRLDLNGRSYEVIGVMPAEVAFPSGVDLWLPFPTEYEFYSNAFGPSGLALMRAGADRAELGAIVEDRAAARYEGAPPGLRRPPARLTSLEDELTGAVRTPLYVLLGIAGMVVLLGCLNLAGLVLARTSRRMNELSVRRALGAARARLFSQLIAEVLVLALVAGLVGLLAASATGGLLSGMLPGDTPGLSEAGLGAPALFFAGALALLAGLLVGLVPSLHGAWAHEHPAAARTSTQDRSRVRTQAVLVTGQVAVATVLVVGAALLGRSLRALEAVPMGYDTESVLTFQVRLTESAYPDSTARAAYLGSLESELRRAPGVRAVGATTFLPQQGSMGIGLRLAPQGAEADQGEYASWVQVSRGYLDAIGVPVLEGRLFDDDGGGRWDRIVLSRALARTIVPEGPAAGTNATLFAGRGDGTVTTVAAVVGDIRLRGRHGDPSRLIFTRMESAPPAYLSFAVRAQSDPAALAEQVRRVARAVDPAVPPFELVTTRQAAAEEIATERAVALLARLFSASALVLAALGLYGLVSQGLTRRRRELGIRLAIGARPDRLVRVMLFRSLLFSALGLAIGLTVAFWASSLLAPLLFQVEARDPWTLALVGAVVLSVAAIAAYLPCRRIVSLDPTEALRAE